MAMSKATQAHIDALNQRENECQWKRSAAEEMYEALKGMVAAEDMPIGGSDDLAIYKGRFYAALKSARAAIAKAEGK